MQNYIILTLLLIIGFGWLQSSIFWIGNRSYSKIYESYCLIKKNSLTKLIYFKPRHFNRYTLDEVVIFFLSYIYLIWSIILISLTIGGVFTVEFMIVNSFIYIGVIFIVMAIKIAFIDITQKIEENWYKTHIPKYLPLEFEEMLSKVDLLAIDEKTRKSIKKQIRWDYKYGNSLMLRGAYNKLVEKNKHNAGKVEKINEQFIHYYKNYKKIKNIKIENNNAFPEYF